MVQSDSRIRVGRALLANLVAVVGVAVLGWSAAALLVVYWVEAAVVTLRGVFQALFARHEPGKTAITSLPGQTWDEKRGGVSLGPLPPIYPRNVSVVLSGLGALAIFWPLAGGGVAATVDAAGGVPVGTVALAVVGVVAGNVLGAADYFRNRRYTDCTPRSVVPARYVFGLFVLGIGGLYALQRAAAPAVVLIAAASAKLLVDLLVAGFDSEDRLGDWAGESLEREMPDGEPIATVRTDRRSLRLRATALTPLFLIAPPYVVFSLVAALAGVFAGWQTGVATLGVAVVVVALGRVVGADVEHGHLEYRVYPTRLVAYDTLLDAPQWVIERRTIENVTVASGVLDAVGRDARTVVVSTYGDDRRLQAVEHPEAFVDAVTAE